MLWRFGERPAAGGDPPLLYDELRHRLRRGDAPWVRLPHNPALILSLLLRVHARGRTVSPREICAFLELPEGTRISGHVSELRKKLAECGGDPQLIEGIQAGTSYQLAPGADAAAVAEAEELQAIEQMLTHPEVTGGARIQLAPLRIMLLVPTAFVIGIALLSWALVRSGGEPPTARLDPQHTPLPPLDPEEGPLPRTLVPQPGVRTFVSPPQAGTLEDDYGDYLATLRPDPNTGVAAEACFELPRELRLRDRDVLAVDVALLPPSVATRIAVSVENVPPKGVVSVAFDVAPGSMSTLRIPALQLASDMRAHGRTICLGEQEKSQGPPAEVVAIKLYAVRVE